MSDEPFFKVRTPKTKRATKKNTEQEKYKRNGKYTGKGLRAKEAILFQSSSQRANDNLNAQTPRETVVGSVLNRDKNQSIALPPAFDREPKLVVKRTEKKNVYAQFV